ncbi:hypothetical protein LTR29_003253 [Friedmanniomyces endolithicus]|nr:hypothetical protein LTR29_003253 [Friedmanniomyces endolithicus]
MGLNTTCPVPAGAQDYGVRSTAWIPLVWSAAACSITTIAIALSLVVLHLRRYRAPREQRQIIRIVFCVIVYAVIAFFEVASYEVAQYIDPLGDLYEAFGLCALYLLFLQYAAPSGTFANDDILSAARAAEETTVSFDWVRVGYIFVFQYPITEIFCVILIESTEATGTYCSYSLYPSFGHIWVEIIQSLGIGACVIAILVFRGNMKQRMKVRRGLAKLVCFKIIVFIRFAQAWVFSLLLQYNVIKTSPTFSYNDILWGIPGLATCAEMVLFSLGFWYAFSSTEYGSNAKPRDSPLPLGKALLDVINPMDLISGIARIFPLRGEIHRSRSSSSSIVPALKQHCTNSRLFPIAAAMRFALCYQGDAGWSMVKLIGTDDIMEFDLLRDNANDQLSVSGDHEPRFALDVLQHTR